MMTTEKTPNRATIKAYNLPFVEQLRTETGVDDITDLINFILVDYKRLRTASDRLLSSPAPQQPEPPSKPDVSDDIAGLLG